MTPRPYSSDDAAREAIHTQLDRSLVVEAAAGTGKTTELVNRIVAVLRTGRARIDQIVAVTFTHKAAGELKLRLRQCLDRERDNAPGEEARNIETALQHLEDAAVGTIHSFCAQILRERPVEAGIDPAFVECAEQESRSLYRRAFRGWFERVLEENPPGLRRALARLAWRDPEGYSATEQLQMAGWKLIEWRDFPAPWTRPEFDRDREIDAVLELVTQLAVMSTHGKPSDALYRALAPARELVTWVERSQVGRERDYDTLEALLVKLPRDLRRERGTGRGSYASGVLRETLIEFRRVVLERLEEFRRRAEAHLAALLQDEMRSLVERYDELKTRSGRLDFNDLLIRVRDLIRGNAEVRRWMQARYTHLFVDEFQDTDPLQAEILLLLAADDPEQCDWFQVTPAPGKLFVVGDPKQSIYKFRRADVLLYQQIRDRLVERGAGLVYLRRSFRSVEPLQACINAAFAPDMTEDAHAGQAGYVALENERKSIPGQPSVIALPVPDPYGSARVSKISIGESLPDATAAFVDWLLKESGWQVADIETKEPREIRASDIGILFRRFLNYGEDITRPYVRALEAREVPHLLVGSKSFHQREEVETMRAACMAIEWPDDELSIYATLHGSLFAITDNVLLRYRSEIGRLHPLAPAPDSVPGELAAVAEVLGILALLHRKRNRRAIAATLNDLLESARAHAGFAFRPGGNQVLGNVYRVVELARAYETGGGISFRGFVDELSSRAERADSAEVPMVEEAAEGVRLMTVHSAKGLEFPVVILADMNANIQSGDPDRYIDTERRLCATRLLWCAPQELVDNEAIERERERAEGVRVAYVAATRARDLLVVPVVGDEEREGWLSPLNKAVYPRTDRRRWSAVAAGCPPFGYRTVLNRPMGGRSEDEPSVKPGEHRAREGGSPVVWWDPETLRLRAEEKFGLARYSMLKGDAEPSVDAYEKWRSSRDRMIEAGGEPTVRVFSPSEGVEGPAGDATPVSYESTVRDVGRPSGRRFGILVHNVLRDALADPSAVREVAEAQARVSGATPEEVEAAIAAVEEALRHPLLERARMAERVHRELPVMHRLDDGRMLEGVLDLAFVEDAQWTIVDFKTDADMTARRSEYEQQLRWYALALLRLTGIPARCVLFGV